MRSLLVTLTLAAVGVAPFVGPSASAQAAPACTITWDGSASTSWHTAANWDLGRVPATGDVVCVGAGATTVHSTGSTTIQTLLSEGTISLTGGTLALTGTGADESSVTAFNLANGTIAGTGTLAVSGTLSWTAGIMSQAGTTRIGPAATLVRDGASGVTLATGRVLEVEGTLDLRTDRAISPTGTPAPLLRSTGLVVKSAGAGTAQILTAMENDGVVRSDAGILELRGGDGAGSSSGSYGAPEAGSVRFAIGSFDLAAGAALLGGVDVSGAALTVVEGASVPATGANALASGSIGGAGTFSIDGPFVWTGGTMAGAGQTIVAAGRELRLPSCCQTLGATRRLVNDGTIAVEGGRLNAAATTRIENDGRIEFRGGDALEGITGGGRLVNTGAIEKTAGTRSSVSMVLANAGTIASAAGELVLASGDGDGAQSGDFGGSGGGEVVFDSGAWDLAAGSRFTGGVAITRADVSVPGGYSLPVQGAARLASPGRLGGDGTVEIQGAFTWSGGTMDDGGLTRVAPGAALTIDAQVALAQGRRLFNGGTVTWLGGTIGAVGAQLVNEGMIDVQSDASSTAALLHNTGTIRKSAGVGTSVLAALIDNDGTVEAASGTLALRGSLINYSALTDSLTAGAYIARNATLELPGEPPLVNAATVVLDGASAHLISRVSGQVPGPPVDSLNGLRRNAGAGELRLAGGADLTTTGPLRNAGLVTMGADSTLTVGGAFTQDAGRTELTDPSSRLAATSYTQRAGALLVETTAAGTGRVASSGAAALAGGLAVVTRAGFTPPPGSTFPFLDAGSVSGTFGSLLEVTPGIDYEISYEATGAVLRAAGAHALAAKAGGEVPATLDRPLPGARGAGGPRVAAARAICRSDSATTLACEVRFPAGARRAARLGTAARATLSRDGRVYARGGPRARVHGGYARIRLRLVRRLRPGAYRLMLTVHRGRDVTVLRRTVRIRGAEPAQTVAGTAR